MSTGDTARPAPAPRELAYVHAKMDHERLVDTALEALRVERGLDDPADGPLLGWLRDSSIKPMVDLRCRARHKLAGVWRTPGGGVFVSWPEVSRKHEMRTGKWQVLKEHGPTRRRVRVQLVIDDSSFALDDDLEVSCPCAGLRALPSGCRAVLAQLYNAALANRPIRHTVEEDLDSGPGRQRIDEQLRRRPSRLLQPETLDHEPEWLT